MEKIILTKRQSEALEMAVNLLGKDRVLECQTEVFEKWNGELEYLNDITLPEIAKALYVGYEVEESKEEKLSKYFKLHDEKGGYFNIGVVEGILRTLKFLDIKIKGINE